MEEPPNRLASVDPIWQEVTVVGVPHSKKNRHVGVGGVGCSCCRPVPGSKKAKRYVNRQDRRTTKVDLLLPREELSATRPKSLDQRNPKSR